MPSEDFLSLIGDSKKLTHKKREFVFEKLVEMSGVKENNARPQVIFGVGVVDNYIIDEKNIKQANKEAMRRALDEVMRKIHFFVAGKKYGLEVFIDGNDNYLFDGLPKKPTFVVGGDGKILQIGAASIIAKVFRDRLMDVYDGLYPDL